MHLHILGICGTFMGGLAALARAAGHTVSGSDQSVFPPMSTQLEALGIPMHRGYDAGALSPPPDLVVVGNVMSRGSPVIEHMLNEGIAYTSGPQWLSEHVLRDRHVLAVAGTHGKTSTASMIAWILECAGLAPGFLIGGAPLDFSESARLGQSPYFVVEADEYDTAFFDKRSKFVHYRSRTLVVTSLEYDHADIFEDMAAIRRQFHHLVRTVPGNGTIIAHADSAEIDRVLAQGCWTPVQRYGLEGSDWTVSGSDGQLTIANANEQASGAFHWPGTHNRLNALAACAAAHAVGVPLAQSVAALGKWQGVRRRLEKLGERRGVTVYDDFAHHPTEIAATLQALRSSIGEARLIAVFEPRSNSMKAGAHRASLAQAFVQADSAWVFRSPDVEWDLDAALEAAPIPVATAGDLEELLERIVAGLRQGDHIVVMSNGSFGGLPQRLLRAL